MKDQQLNHLDFEVMQIVWQWGQATIYDVLDHIGRKIPYTSVASSMKSLEKRGFLSHQLVGRTFLYHPLTQKSEISHSMLRDLLERFFDNSASRLVNALIEVKQIDITERKLLQQIINQKEGESDE